MKEDKYKFRYEVDPLNRLVISRPFAPDSPLYKKIVVEGRFAVAGDNSLEYYVESLDPEAQERLSEAGLIDEFHKIRFSGQWALTPEHDLKFSLYKAGTRELGDSLILTGRIVSVGANELLFSIAGRGKESVGEPDILKLSGNWQAGAGNRLEFLVQKHRQEPDALLFKGGWQTGKNYEIIYQYEKTQLKTKTRTDEKFILTGLWEIGAKRELKFLVEGDNRSSLDFKAMLRTPVIYAKKGEVRYNVGIGLSAKKEAEQTISFFGKWHLNRDLSLDFMVRYKPGEVRLSHFQADYSINSRNKIGFALKNEEGQRLGVEVIFTRRFFKDAEAFIRWRDSADEKAIETGIRIPF